MLLEVEAYLFGDFGGAPCRGGRAGTLVRCGLGPGDCCPILGDGRAGTLVRYGLGPDDCCPILGGGRAGTLVSIRPGGLGSALLCDRRRASEFVVWPRGERPLVMFGGCRRVGQAL